MQLNADKTQGWRVYTSLGIFSQMMPFLDPSEQTTLQQSCQFCYESAVGRVQTRVFLKKNFFFWKYDEIYQVTAFGKQWREVEKV